jgi:hypothetical protein
MSPCLPSFSDVKKNAQPLGVLAPLAAVCVFSWWLRRLRQQETAATLEADKGSTARTS